MKTLNYVRCGICHKVVDNDIAFSAIFVKPCKHCVREKFWILKSAIDKVKRAYLRIRVRALRP